jgi:exosortase family protein XrtG
MKPVLLVLGVLILISLYLAGVFLFRKYRAWLTYYLLAAFGLTLLLVLGARWISLSDRIEALVTYMTHLLSSAMGIKSKFLGQSQIMVADPTGWVLLQTNIECSALIESSILAGLVFFYPAFDIVRKIKYFAIGLVVTVVANALRMLIITSMTAYLGRSYIFWGHAIVGRLFFFAAVITLYWYILTRPTVSEVAKIVSREEKEVGSLKLEV